MDNFATISRLVLQFPLITLALGLVIWLLGWKIYKLFILVAGVFIGAHLALRFSYVPALQGINELFLIILGGVLGGMLAFFAMYVMFFFTGVSIGFDLVAGSVSQHAEILGLLFGLALGLAFVILFKIFVVVATSYIGSLLILESTVQLFGFRLTRLFFALALVVLSAVGIVMQYQVWGRPRNLEPQESGK